MKHRLAWLRRHWGFALLTAFSLLSLVRLLLQKVPGHYRVFTGAGSALWHVQNPYGTDFGTQVGYYFYSPTCALTVFGPLSFLPEKLGIVIYMTVSWLLFVGGVRRFWEAFSRTRSPALLQWFWAAITAQLVGGILASKLEIAIVGILLGSIATLRADAPRMGRRGLGAAALLAMILNWKFQPLPIVGLLVLSWLLIWKSARLPLAIAAFLAAWYALPFAIFPTAYLLQIHDTWQLTFAHFVSESVLNFENVFAFAHRAFGADIGFHASQLVSAAVGAAMALFTALWIRRATRDRLGGALILSVALGTAFITALSPLGQNNAMILYAPLLLCAVVRHERTRHPIAWLGMEAAVVSVMILAYSDVVPHDAREALRGLAIKSVACLLLGIAVAWDHWRDVAGSPGG